jgi:hypothetical protein
MSYGRDTVAPRKINLPALMCPQVNRSLLASASHVDNSIVILCTTSLVVCLRCGGSCNKRDFFAFAMRYLQYFIGCSDLILVADEKSNANTNTDF